MCQIARDLVSRGVDWIPYESLIIKQKLGSVSLHITIIIIYHVLCYDYQHAL